MTQSDLLRALVLPFDKGDLPLPERAFLMRAEPSEVLDAEWRSRLVCEQSFKPAYDRLLAAGYDATARLEGAFEAGLCLLTKHKAENRANIARAWSLLRPGGLLVCCGANALGAQSVEREVERVFGLDGHLSKHLARTFWLRRGDSVPEAVAEWQAGGEPGPVADTGLVARAGCFSPDHVDTGSRILAGCFPEGIAGRVADLGAGWGYLSVDLLRRFPDITHLDLFEAEALALEDARTNIGPDPAAEVRYHWHDVCAGLPAVKPPEVVPPAAIEAAAKGAEAPARPGAIRSGNELPERYDWIVSNPPFHDGGKADPAIGRAFITAAWKAIRRRGKFLLVANQHLPYEAELRRRFREVEQVTVAEGFKVYLASNRHEK